MRFFFTAILLLAVAFCRAQHSNTVCGCPAGAADTLDGKQVLLTAEKMPLYPGGTTAFLSALIPAEYPAQQKDLQTSIFLSFVIDANGKLRNPCIYRPLYGDHLSPLENEVLKNIASLPAWQPGEQNGVPVRVRLSVPVRIEIR